MEKLNREQAELLPKFYRVKSFYGKASFETIRKGGEVLRILTSYKSKVMAILETKSGKKYIYLNNKIDKSLLFSQTTLRHIKEFLKQFYNNETYTKADILKNAILIDFDFILYNNSNNGESLEIKTWENYYRATSKETSKWFRGFDKYRERQTADTQGRYLFTKCAYGFSDYYFYYL